MDEQLSQNEETGRKPPLRAQQTIAKSKSRVEEDDGSRKEMLTVSRSSSISVLPLGVSRAFMKILLKETDDMLLFDHNSFVVLADSAEAKAIQEDTNKSVNRMLRKTVDVESQTLGVLFKSRSVNTAHIKKKNVKAFVSNYDMFDTYNDLAHQTESLNIGMENETGTFEVTTYFKENLDDLSHKLQKSKSLKLLSMMMQRILAGNIFHERQIRFRDMEKIEENYPAIVYKYDVKLLFKYRSHDTMSRAVSAFAWCPTNSDLLAIAYGSYRFLQFQDRSFGSVCIWSIKNPVNPERIYKYTVPATALAFSKDNHQLLAVGLYNGVVEIIDVADPYCSTKVSISQRDTSQPIEPIWEIKWVKVKDEANEMLLAVSQDGYVMKYTLTNTPILIGHQQMRLDRSKADIKNVGAQSKISELQANRFAQALFLQISPLDPITYYVGTDEGFIHQCSLFYPYKFMSTLRAHKYGVLSMEYSPWSPRIFLTCGTDWYARVWIDGICEPIIELCNGFEPISCVRWCPANSTIITYVTRTKLEIWDIKTNCLLPAASHSVGSHSFATVDECLSDNLGSSDQPMRPNLTVCEFRKCGHSIVVGDESGTTYVFELENIPSPPHFQYEALEQALVKNVSAKPFVLQQITSLGYMGY